MVEVITHSTLTLGILIRNPALGLGERKFLTPDEALLQVACFNYAKGTQIQPHIHKNFERKIPKTAEVIGVKSGVLKVDFFDEQKTYLKSIRLKDGDFIVLLDGGHGFEVEENCEFFEVKQGPFAGTDVDKVKF